MWLIYNDISLRKYYPDLGGKRPTKREVEQAKSNLLVALYMHIIDANDAFKFYNKPPALDCYMQDELLLTMSRDLIFPDSDLEVFSEL